MDERICCFLQLLSTLLHSLPELGANFIDLRPAVNERSSRDFSRRIVVSHVSSGRCRFYWRICFNALSYLFLHIVQGLIPPQWRWKDWSSKEMLCSALGRLGLCELD